MTLLTTFFSIIFNYSKRLLLIKSKQYIETRILKSISCYIKKYPRIFFLFNLVLEILFFINLFQVLLGSSFLGIFFFFIKISLFSYIKSLPLYLYIKNYCLGILRNLYPVINNSLLNTKIWFRILLPLGIVYVLFDLYILNLSFFFLLGIFLFLNSILIFLHIEVIDNKIKKDKPILYIYLLSMFIVLLLFSLFFISIPLNISLEWWKLHTLGGFPGGNNNSGNNPGNFQGNNNNSGNNPGNFQGNNNPGNFPGNNNPVDSSNNNTRNDEDNQWNSSYNFEWSNPFDERLNNPFTETYSNPSANQQNSSYSNYDPSANQQNSSYSNYDPSANQQSSSYSNYNSSEGNYPYNDQWGNFGYGSNYPQNVPMNSSFYDPANNQNSNLFTNPVNDPTNDNNNPLNYPVNDAANYSSSNTTNYPFNNPYSSTSTDKPRSPSKIITELQKKRKHSDDEVEIEGNSSLDWSKINTKLRRAKTPEDDVRERPNFKESSDKILRNYVKRHDIKDMKDIEYNDYDRVENNLFQYFYEKVVRNTKNLEKYFDKKEEGMTRRTIENYKKSINLVNEERGILAFFKKRKEKGFSNTFSNDSTLSNKKRKSNKDI